MKVSEFLATALMAGLPGCVYIDDSTEQERLDPDGDGILWPGDCDDASSERCLLWGDSFDDALDTAAWLVDGLDCGSGMSHDYQQSGGYLELRAQSPGSGLTYGSSVWAQPKIDWNMGVDIELELDLSLDGTGSGICQAVIEISDDDLSGFQDLGCDENEDYGTLYNHDIKSETYGRHFLLDQSLCQEPFTGTLTICFSAQDQTATLFEGSGCEGEVLGEVELADLGTWSLRVLGSAATASHHSAIDLAITLDEISAYSRQLASVTWDTGSGT